MKNQSITHKFEIVSGYDPEEDGPEPRWGRVGVRCGRCGEERRVAVSPSELALIGGCCRMRGPQDRFTARDLVVREGALDEFIRYLPDDRALTYNAGGHYHESPVSDLKPY